MLRLWGSAGDGGLGLRAPTREGVNASTASASRRARTHTSQKLRPGAERPRRRTRLSATATGWSLCSARDDHLYVGDVGDENGSAPPLGVVRSMARPPGARLPLSYADSSILFGGVCFGLKSFIAAPSQSRLRRWQSFVGDGRRPAVPSTVSLTLKGPPCSGMAGGLLPPPDRSNLLSRNRGASTTLCGGSLGSCVDEERSQLRELM